jgi:hypothetical protein
MPMGGDVPVNDDDAAMPESAGSNDRSEPGVAARRAGLPRPALIGGGFVIVLALAFVAPLALWPDDEPTGQVRLSASPTSATSLPAASTTASPSDDAPPPPVASPTPDPTPRSGPAMVAWTQGARMDGSIHAVAHIADLWLIGGALPVNEGGQAAVWTSSDGETWASPALLQPVPRIEPDDFPEDDQWFPDSYRVTGFGEWRGNLYAYGVYQFGCCDGVLGMLWESVDGGATWLEVGTEGTGYQFGYFEQASSVTPADELAVFAHTGLGGGASMFITDDLRSWTEHPIGDATVAHEFAGFAASPDTMVVVGGEYQPYEGDERPPLLQSAWWSADGRSWAPMAGPEREGELASVAWDPAHERFVVVGSDASGQPMAWLTVDGTTWASSQLAEGAGSVQDVAATDGLIAAVGAIGSGEDAQPTAWTSHDGITWRVVSIADTIGAVAVSSDTAVAIGAPETSIGRLTE